MRTGAPIFIALMLVAASGLAAAQTDQDAQIQDEEGDVDAQHLFDTGALTSDLDDSEVPQEDIETSGDVVRAWFHDETPNAFRITIELSNIPNNESFPAPVAEVWTHFVVKQTQYHIEGELASPGEGMPLEPRYQLYENDVAAGTLTGDVDRADNKTWVIVPKEKIGSPEPGDTLTEPYITTHVPQEGLGSDASPVLDYAPSPHQIAVSQDVEPTDVAPAVIGLGPTLDYGEAYEFGDYPGAGGLFLEVQPSAVVVTAGETATAELVITNDAPDAHDVQLAADAPSGWDIGAETASLTIAPGATDRVQVSVTPASGADGQEIVRFSAATTGLADDASLSVTAQPASSGSGGSDAGDTGGSSDDGSSTSLTDDASSSGAEAEEGEAGEEQNGAPSPAAWLIASVTGAVAWVTRRRR